MYVKRLFLWFANDDVDILSVWGNFYLFRFHDTLQENCYLENKKSARYFGSSGFSLKGLGVIR